MYCSLARSLLENCNVVWSGTSRRNIKNIERIQRSMTRYGFKYAEVDYRKMAFPLTMRGNLLLLCFFECLYGRYDVDVHDFVSQVLSLMVYAPLVTRTRIILNSVCCRPCFKRNIYFVSCYIILYNLYIYYHVI